MKGTVYCEVTMATLVFPVCSMSTKGTTKDEKLVNLWFGVTSNPDSPEDGSTIWKSSSPSLSNVDGTVVWVLVTVGQQEV